MRVSKQQAGKNREAILRVASTQLRERGFGELSAAEVAKTAGLTHGALYSHFDSKEALLAAAVARAYEESAAGFAGLDGEQLVSRYLSAEHRDNAGCGCPSAALLSEVPQQPDPVRAAFSEGMARFAGVIGDSLAADGDQPEKEVALFTLAAMVGGLALARALRDHDPAASDTVLQAVAGQLRQRVLGPGGAEQSVATDRAGKRRKPV